jgi:hypothetical protein
MAKRRKYSAELKAKVALDALRGELSGLDEPWNITRSLSMTGQAKRASSIRNHQLVIFGIETMAGHTGDTPSGHEHG